MNNNGPYDPNYIDINQMNPYGQYTPPSNKERPIDDGTIQPRGIDLKSFLPNESPKSQKISESQDKPIINEVLQDCDQFKKVMNNRMSILDQIKSNWNNNRKKEALTSLSVYKDIGSYNDFFHYAFLKTDINRIGIKPDDVIIALPMVIELISSKYDYYIRNGILTARRIIKMFSEIIINTKQMQALGRGIDLNREEKIRKYDVIIDLYKKIRNLHIVTSQSKQIEGINMTQFVGELDYFFRKCQNA